VAEFAGWLTELFSSSWLFARAQYPQKYAGES
jgi:hypothetical protein